MIAGEAVGAAEAAIVGADTGGCFGTAPGAGAAVE